MYDAAMVDPSPPNRPPALFLAGDKQRQNWFRDLCGDLFAPLLVADTPSQAADIAAASDIDCLIVDLEHFDRFTHALDFEALFDGRPSLRTLLLCPFDRAGRVLELASYGIRDYGLAPFRPGALQALVSEFAAAPGQASAGELEDQLANERELRALLRAMSEVQLAVTQILENAPFALKLCHELCKVAGVVHAAFFHLDPTGETVLLAEDSPFGLTTADLLAAPLKRRGGFPGLAPIRTGNLVLLDDLDKLDDRALSARLDEAGIASVIGIPVAPRGGELERPSGSLSLMLQHRRPLTPAWLGAFIDLGQMAEFGLQVIALSQQKEELVSQLQIMATTDMLTGAANRRRGDALLRQERERSLRYGTPLSVILFDIDHFKQVNDRHGHHIGDLVLTTLSQVTRSNIRTSDLLSRWGGEEFLIIAPNTDLMGAIDLAEKIRRQIAAAPIQNCGSVTASFGTACLTGKESVETLLQRADAALYRAKESGRNRVMSAAES